MLSTVTIYTLTCSDNKEDSGGSSSPGQLILSRIQLCPPLVVTLNIKSLEEVS